MPAGRPVQNLRISVDYDSSWASASVAMRQGFAAAVTWLENNICIPVTIRAQVIWAATPGANAETFWFSHDITSGYAQVRAALVKNARSAIAQQAIANCFPASDPYGGATMVMLASHMRILGLWESWPANNASWDQQHTFNSGGNWFYGANGNPASSTDAFAVAVHELTEGLGRFMNDTGTAFVAPMEYMRWKAAGQRQNGSQTNTPSYFSIDGGTTNLRNFNSSASGDPMDWDSAVVDAFNAAGGNGVQPFSQTDKWLLDALGMPSIPNPA